MTFEKNFSSTKLNILVAEDEEYNFLFISEVLQEYSVNLTRAYNGKMALDLCAKMPDIDLVLMDVSMPVMDGLEATKKIKQLSPELPVIIQSSYASLSDKSIAFDAGCDDYLSKPFTRSELVKRIKAYKPEGVHIEKA